MEYQNESERASSPSGENQPPIPSSYPPLDSSSEEIPPLKPNNWLWQSIVATIFCCLPFGIIGIIFATKVDSLYYNGQYAEAERASRKTKMWLLLAVLAWFIYLIMCVLMVVTGNVPEYMENIIENNASGYNF